MGRGHGTAPPFVGAGGRFGRRHRRVADGLFWYPDLFSDYYEPVETEEPPAEQQAAVQQPAAASQPASKPIEPLLLEERDGQWVRVPTGNQVPVSTAGAASSARVLQASATRGETAPSPTVAPLPPAVLIFRDGHTEEVSKYMIEGETLYVSADYWSTGSWSRRIPLSQLDIPASLKANAARGVQFNLPRGPNQVVVRF